MKEFEDDKFPKDSNELSQDDKEQLSELLYKMKALATIAGCEINAEGEFIEKPSRAKGLFTQGIAPFMEYRLDEISRILKGETDESRVMSALSRICAQQPDLFLLALCVYYLQKAKALPGFTEREKAKEVGVILAMCPHLTSVRHFQGRYRLISDNPEKRIDSIPLERFEETVSLLKEIPEAQLLAKIDRDKKLGRGFGQG